MVCTVSASVRKAAPILLQFAAALLCLPASSHGHPPTNTTPLTSIATVPHAAAAIASETKPNLVLILADDCTFRDIGCYGGQALTPHIDRLAQQGMRFTRCFQAAPMCSPTRHNLYTGQYPVKSGAYPNHTFVREGVKSIAHDLQPLGYRIALSGKTHIRPRDSFPFEYSSANNNPNMKVIDSLMQQCASSQTPFCLLACSNEPHSPWNKGDASQYDADQITLPDYFVDTPETRGNMVNYLAEITYFDSQVGQILDLLDQHQLSDNTLVMVLSEQGSSFPFGKWTCYDTGLQSACVVRWPGQVQPGTVIDAMVEYVDVLPTFVEAAGGSMRSELDGRSFLNVLLGKATSHKSYVFGEMTTRGIINGSDYFGIRSVRSERFKYIVNFTPDMEFTNACTNSTIFKSWQKKAATGDQHAEERVRRYSFRPAIELYDLVTDPNEWNNLAHDPQYADVQKELQRQLQRWMDHCGDQGQQTELDAKQHQGSPRPRRPQPG